MATKKDEVFIPVRDKLTKVQKKGLEKPTKHKRRKVNPYIKKRRGK